MKLGPLRRLNYSKMDAVVAAGGGYFDDDNVASGSLHTFDFAAVADNNNISGIIYRWE